MLRTRLLIEPAQNLTGSIAGPSELLYEPAQLFFSKSQEVGWNGSRWEDVLLIAAWGSLPQPEKVEQGTGFTRLAGNRGGTLL